MIEETIKTIDCLTQDSLKEIKAQIEKDNTKRYWEPAKTVYQIRQYTVIPYKVK